MGFGDVKLAGVLGICLGFLGWGVLVVGGLRGLPAGWRLRRRPDGRRQGPDARAKIPYGPFMLAGALLAVLVGQQTC